MASKGKKTKSPIPVNATQTDKRSSKNKKKDEDKENLAFKVLSQDQTKEILEIKDVDALQEKMVGILEVSNHVNDLKEGAVLDYYVSGLWWCQQQTFTVEQTSAFYTLLHNLLENVKEKQLTVTDNLRMFKKCMAGIGVDYTEQSGGLECFNTDQAKLITQYVQTSLFQHYRMYEYLFSHTQAEEIIGTDLDLEIPKPADMPWPPPLQEGVTEEQFKSYIAPPPPTPDIQPAETEEEKKEGGEGDGAETADDQKVGDLLSQLSPEDVRGIMNSVFDELLGGLKTDVAAKLREKENALINRINKVHVVADK